MPKKEMTAIYAAGLLQGISLVSFPAASTIFTSPHAFDFSSSQYGSLFISQCVLSILFSYTSPKISRYRGAKTTYLLGLAANFISMALLALSTLTQHQILIAYPLLIVATAFLGTGFGLTVPTLNTMAAALLPQKVDSVILVLNALLGIGTTLAPVFISFFIQLGSWWGLPLLMLCSLFLLFLLSLPLSLPGDKTEEEKKTTKIPKGTWIFMGFALIYGIIETLNGNWASIYMKEIQHAAVSDQTLALTLFWAMVTVGRVFFALLDRYVSERTIFQILPFVAAVSFILISALPADNVDAGLFGFALAGFGCSALLPLIISFGTKQLKAISKSVAGDLVAFYLLGYGIAAFGAGELLDWAAFNLSGVYAIGAFLAVLLGAIAYLIRTRA